MPDEVLQNDSWSVIGESVRLHVRLTPKADRDAIDGIVCMADGRSVLAVRVRAVPEKGKANKALIALIAKQLKLTKSSVTLASGVTSRIKGLRIDEPSKAVLDRLAVLAA